MIQLDFPQRVHLREANTIVYPKKFFTQFTILSYGVLQMEQYGLLILFLIMVEGGEQLK